MLPLSRKQFIRECFSKEMELTNGLTNDVKAHMKIEALINDIRGRVII